MNGFVCKVINSDLKVMKLFLSCPQCTHLFESTSTQLIENAGRIECPSCEYLFDGYAHYRFDGLEADEPVKVKLLREPSTTVIHRAPHSQISKSAMDFRCFAKQSLKAT